MLTFFQVKNPTSVMSVAKVSARRVRLTPTEEYIPVKNLISATSVERGSQLVRIFTITE